LDDGRFAPRKLFGKTNPNGITSEGTPLLALAAELGSYKVVKLLIAQSSIIKLDAAQDGKPTAFMWAALNGKAKVVRKLAAKHGKGLDVNKRTPSGRTAFNMAAAIDADMETIECLFDLIKNGVEVDLTMPNWTGSERYQINIDPFLVPTEETKEFVYRRAKTCLASWASILTV
jgi:hypothetical protein